LGGQLGVAASQPGDDLVERATEDLLHREVHAAVGRIADVVDRHDRGVLEAALDPRLANEACAGAGPAGPRATDDLERDPPTDVAVVAGPHLAHAAASEHAPVLVAGPEVGGGLARLRLAAVGAA